MHVIAFYGHLGLEVIHSWSSPGFNMEKCAILNRSTIIHLKTSSDYPYFSYTQLMESFHFGKYRQHFGKHRYHPRLLSI